MATVWYRVRDLDAGRAFYRDVLGFEEVFVDFDDGWSRLKHGGMEIALAESASRASRAVSRTSTSTT